MIVTVCFVRNWSAVELVPPLHYWLTVLHDDEDDHDHDDDDEEYDEGYDDNGRSQPVSKQKWKMIRVDKCEHGILIAYDCEGTLISYNQAMYKCALFC